MTESPSNQNAVTTPDVQPTLDVLFDALANQRRRYILSCLSASRTPMALADVADEVAILEQETPLPDISAEQVKRVYLSLHHSHIPKLADANIVEYTQEQDLVTLSETSERVKPFLERAAANE